MKTILTLLVLATLILTGCQSTNHETRDQTTISETGISLRSGIDPYETSNGYPNPPAPPRDAMQPEY